MSEIAPEMRAGMDARSVLIGRVGALFLGERLAEESSDAGAGTARFILDCLSPAHTAAIAHALLADPALAPQFEIHLPAHFVAGLGLPEAVLTHERATYYRNSVSERPALLVANTGDDEEQSLRDVTAVSAGDLQANAALWVQVAGAGLPISEEHRKWWTRALAGMQDLRFVPLDRYAGYVLRVRELIEDEGFIILHALGAALSELRMPRDRCYFEAMPEPVRTHPSRWRALYASAYSKRASYLSKQTPSGGVLAEADLRAAFERVRGSIPDAVHPEVEAFIAAPAGWTAASAALAQCEWETIKPLFDGLRRERFNLGAATLAFYGEGNPDLLSDAERGYLERLIGRRTSGAELEEDQTFYNAHRDELREDRKLKAAWDKFIFGAPREANDFIAGLVMSLEGFPWETAALRRTLRVRSDRRYRRELRELNIDAGLFFAHRYRGLQALLGRSVQFDLGELLDFPEAVRAWRAAGEPLNESESKASLQLKFSVELEIETQTGASETYSTQFIWRFDPLAVSCEMPGDWSRLVEHPLVLCRVGRERAGGKTRSQTLDLFNVRTLRAAYGQARGSLVAAYKPAHDVKHLFEANLAEARARALVGAEAARDLAERFAAFAEAYHAAILGVHEEGLASSAAEAQLAPYGDLLEALCRLAPGDRSRELMLRPVLQLGTVHADGGVPAAIVAPWHPLRMAAMRRKARRAAALIRTLLDSEEVRFADARLFFRDVLAELRHPLGPEVVLAWVGEKAELLALSEVAGDYSLHELPVTRADASETNENPLDAAGRVAELVERYLTLHPHEQANLSVVLYNCDSAGLPLAVVSKLAGLGDQEEGTRCQVILRHRDSRKLRALYEEIVEASDANGDVVVSSETTRDFMARLRIGIMADQAPPPDPRDGCPEDIVFSQDVIARHASVNWFPVEVRPLVEGSLAPTQWSRRRPATRGDMRSVVYLAAPEQAPSGWAYLTALSTFLRGDWDARADVRYLPARQLDFRDPATARIVEETHNLGSWVANYDELLDRRQLLEQDVRVIRYKQSATPGRNLIVSSRAPLGLLRSMILARLRALNLPLAEAELRPLAEQFIDVANGLSGDIVLRAAKRGQSASELMGLVLSRYTIGRELGENSGAWFFLDDYVDWLGAREEQIADLLALTPTAGTGERPLLRVTVVESKYVEAASLARKRKESARQLRSTLRRLSGALSEVPHLDRDLWLARISDLLVDGTRLPTAGEADVAALRRALRERRCDVELRGYSQVFVSTPAEGPDISGCTTVEDPAEGSPDAFQEVFSRDLVRDLVLRFASGEAPVDVRRSSGSALWSHAGAQRPERAELRVPVTGHHPATPVVIEGRDGAGTAETVRAGREPAVEPIVAAAPTPRDVFAERPGEPALISPRAAQSHWFAATETPAPAPTDPRALEWLRRVEMATRAALQQFNLHSRLVSATLTPNAALLKFQGSANLTVDQVLRRRAEFLTTHGLQLVGVQPEPGLVSLSIARPEREVVTLRSAWQRWAPQTESGNQTLLIGVREDDGTLLTLAPGQHHAPHTLIAGSTGSGKSVLMQDIILGIAATNRPDQAQIILIDPKQGVDYFAFEALQHLRGGIIDRQEAALEQIHALVTEMDARYARLRSARARDLREFNARAAPGDRMPVLWLIHDEFAEWMLAEEYKEEVTSAVARLGVKARAAGIHLVFAAQRPEASVMPMQLRANLGNRLVLRVDSEGTSEIALGERGAERLLGRGHMMAKLEGLPGTVYAQVPYASPADLDVVVAEIVAHISR